MPLTDAQRLDFMVVVKGSYAAGGGTTKNTANILTYRRTVLPAPWVPANTLTAWVTACKTAWKAATSASWTMASVEIRCINDAIEGTTVAVIGEAGGIAGDMLPNYAAMVINKKTALRGKSYRGRIYIGGIPESGNVNNALTNGQKTLLDTLTTALAGTITDADGNQFVPTVLSQLKSKLKLSPSIVVATVITSMTARQQVGTMNSRKSPVVS